MFSKSTKFSLKGTVESQMSEFAAMRVSDPARSSSLCKLGEDLDQLAANGQMRKIVQHVNSAEDGDILFYFIVKMLHSALINDHLMIATFIIDQGYPLHSSIVPNALLDALSVVDDSLAISVIEFLVLAHGMDINSQAKRTWLTPLHIAVQRGLSQTVDFLLDHGADINAVAEGDSMPLTLADKLDASLPEKSIIIEMLTKRGAKRSWRKDTAPSSGGKVVFKSFSGGDSSGNFSTFNPPTQNSMVSFRGGGDSTGVFNVGSIKTTSSGGWRKNCSSVDSAVISTSSSSPLMNLAEVLNGSSPLGSDSSGTELGSVAEPKELPAVRLPCDFSSNSYHSREKLPRKFGNLSISEVLVEEDVKEVEEGMEVAGAEDEAEDEEDTKRNDGKEWSIEEESKEGKQDGDEAQRCPYYLSDDGAFVFSTN